MAAGETWAGWIRFAAILMLIIAFLDVCEGLIAIIRGGYYTRAPNQVLVVDTRSWGWIMLIWGLVVGAAGLGLGSGANWARWFTIVVGSLNLILQLGFVGSSRYPLWALTVLALNVVILYAVIVHWGEARQAIKRMAESRY